MKQRALTAKLSAMLFPQPLKSSARHGSRSLRTVVWRIPLGLIPMPGDENPLSAQHDLTMLPSLATLRWLRSGTREGQRGNSVAVFADPV